MFHIQCTLVKVLICLVTSELGPDIISTLVPDAKTIEFSIWSYLLKCCWQRLHRPMPVLLECGSVWKYYLHGAPLFNIIIKQKLFPCNLNQRRNFRQHNVKQKFYVFSVFFHCFFIQEDGVRQVLEEMSVLYDQNQADVYVFQLAGLFIVVFSSLILNTVTKNIHHSVSSGCGANTKYSMIY